MDFQFDDQTRALLEKVRHFIDEKIRPLEAHIHQDILTRNAGADWTQWKVHESLAPLKKQAREAGLWNLFLPDATHGAGLTNLQYAPIAEATGHSLLAPEVFNCNAPDTGNMEVLWKYGSEQQKQQWLTPLLDGDIRSAFCMTEPAVASSDATNMQATATLDGHDVILNGTKWWSTGIGHPDCKVLIFMGLTDPQAPRHQQHSMVLVPMSTPGIEIRRMLPVFGEYDEPYGHGEVHFNNVRVPQDNIIHGPGKGFEIAQGRLGPGRIHHCMRCIGAAEETLSQMITRSTTRSAFGKPLINLGGNRERLAQARIAIDQARLLTLQAAWKMDTVGVFGALTDISAIKVVAPNVLQQVVDDAIQLHGGAGLSGDFPLAAFYAQARALRLADGPDEVHLGMVAKLELSKYGFK